MTVTIDARPFPFKLNKKAAALIIIDMQRDFVEPGGFGESLGNDVRPLQEIVPVVEKLLDGFRQQGMHIIHTRESHLADLSDCPPSKLNRGSPSLRIGDKGPMGRILVQGEHGTGIVDELLPKPEEIVIDKPGKGAFYATDLDAIARNLGINQFVFAGVTTEVCVQTTMREANDRGYECLLATDATESYFPEFKKATIDMIEAQGAIVGWTATTDQILEAISG